LLIEKRGEVLISKPLPLSWKKKKEFVQKKKGKHAGSVATPPRGEEKEGKNLW